jgi:hypothetical protein
MPLNEKQIKQLLQPINPKRVLRDGKGNAHVAQQDVTAHLTRIFGFGNWSKDVLSVELVFEEPRLKDGKPTGRWDVCYKALVRLEINDEHGNFLTAFEDGSMGTALNQTRGDAHDLAYKSAISLSTKRAAKDLGDQFGLSLYNKGQMTALVGATLVGLPDEVEEVQSHVEQQVSMGNDEIDRDPDPADVARDVLRQYCVDNGLSLNAVAQEFAGDGGVTLKDATADQVIAYMNLLKADVVKAG